MRQLSQGLLVQQQKPRQPLQQENSQEQNFSERLFAERQKRRILASPKKMNSIQQTLAHLTAAHEQEQQRNVLMRDTAAVARHLKTAISQMHSLVNNGKENRRRPLDTEAFHVSEAITGTVFETSVRRLAHALVANDDDKSNAFLMHTAIVKQGIKAAITKLHYVLEENVTSFKEMQDLSERLALVRQNNDPNTIMARLADDPAATASVVTSAIARFLDDETTGTRENGEHDTSTLFDNLMTLLWTQPVDNVVGSFFWSFAGLGSFRDKNMTPLQSSIFDIQWVMDMIGCWEEKGILC